MTGSGLNNEYDVGNETLAGGAEGSSARSAFNGDEYKNRGTSMTKTRGEML